MKILSFTNNSEHTWYHHNDSDSQINWGHYESTSYFPVVIDCHTCKKSHDDCKWEHKFSNDLLKFVK